MPDPTLDVPRPPWRRFLSTALAVGKTQLTKRAFPTRGAAKDVKGKAVPKLSPKYAKYKKKKGRPGVADQRFTSKTAEALGQLKLIDTGNRHEAVLGFRTRRAIAEGLQKRNNFMGHTEGEQRKIRAAVQSVVAQHAASVKVKHGKIVIRVV